MNPLAALKEKLMIKPNVEDRERIAVVIKGVKKHQKPIAEKEEAPKLVLENEEKAVKEEPTKMPLIVDETEKGYDIDALKKKLLENKKLTVTVKPIMKVSEDKKTSQPLPLPVPKKIQKLDIKKQLIIEDDEEAEADAQTVAESQTKVRFEIEPEEVTDIIPIKEPKKKQRFTPKVEKGVAILGPETLVEIGDTDLRSRMPKRAPPVIIKVSSYYMNNREIFVNFINSLFEPYRKQLEENTENISCDTIGQTNTNFNLLTHQKIVRDYMNLYTPYRGLLLYHGLGSGKTATSIAIAEGMKDSKRVIIMTPASLRANYIEELKKAGDLLYKRNQYWEWISTIDNPNALTTISALLNLPQEYIRSHNGAFFINIKTIWLDANSNNFCAQLPQNCWSHRIRGTISAIDNDL